MSKIHPKRSTPKSNSQLRIIGGQWRGRKLSFPAIEGLRPTPDRVRETLFNWLSTHIFGARCLDLFAGSGALGLEALSRGAEQVDFVDNSQAATLFLRQNLALVSADNAKVSLNKATAWLQQLAAQTDQPLPYNIIFLDPPFHKNMVDQSIRLIDELKLLAPLSWVYLEMNHEEELPSMPDNWHLHREKIAGQVCYRLYRINDQIDSQSF